MGLFFLGVGNMRRFITFILCVFLCFTAVPSFALDSNPELDAALGDIFKSYKTVGATLVVA